MIESRVLEGKHVRLQPLSLDHLDALCEVGLDESLWEWSPYRLGSEDDMRAYIHAALEGQRQRQVLPFATMERTGGRIVGCTRFCAINLANKRAEIGATWIAPPWQRTAVNTEAKLLMLQYAFETLHLNRVEFKTDSLNARSRAAILRIGARQEGTFRKHMVTTSGRLRDTIYFSIIDDEWPQVETNLRHKLASHAAVATALENRNGQ